MPITKTVQIIDAPTIDFYIEKDAPFEVSDVLAELDALKLNDIPFRANLAIAIMMCEHSPTRFVCELEKIEKIVYKISSEPEKYPLLQKMFKNIISEEYYDR